MIARLRFIAIFPGMIVRHPREMFVLLFAGALMRLLDRLPPDQGMAEMLEDVVDDINDYAKQSAEARP